MLEVQKSAKGPSIVLSRIHEGFIRGLFALEVPEIAEGIVEIKGIAREAGDRTKIAVSSKDEKVDCVGACVGMRGTRVKNIVRELHGEKVDIIRWQEAISEFIAAALSPAKIAEIRPEADAKQALVIVDDSELSLAIGKKGQNVRLASKLTDWQLEIKSRSQASGVEVTLRGLSGVGPTMEARLAEARISTVEQLAALTLEQLTAIKGIGEKTAQKLLESATQALAAKVQAQASGRLAGAAASSEADPASQDAETPTPAEAGEPASGSPEEGGTAEESSETEASGDPPAEPQASP